MMKRILLPMCAGFCMLAAFAQQDPVLLRVNGREILRSEFEYAYRRDAEVSDVKRSPKEYLPLFIEAELKAEAAEAAGIAVTPAFRRQQEVHRARLVEACLIGPQLMDSCLQALYRQEVAKPHTECVVYVQILKRLPQNITNHRLERERSVMDSLYRSAQTLPDAEFITLCMHCSDDAERHRIGYSETTDEFEERVFSLAKGEVSRPFLTAEGFHIVKVLEREEPPAFQQVAPRLTERLRRKFLLGGTVGSTWIDRLKTSCRYIPHTAGINELLQQGTTERTLFTIDGQSYTGTLFKQFAASHPQSVKQQLKGFITKSLLDYESSHIDGNHPEIRLALQAADKDFLIAEITRRTVEEPSVNDRAGLATYFKFHTSDYRWESPRYKGIVLHCVDKKTAKQAKKLLKKNPETEWESLLGQTLNSGGVERVQFKKGVFAQGTDPYVDRYVFKQGKPESPASYPFTIVYGKKKKGPDDYREVLEMVRRDYRNFLEAHWMQELRENSRVETDSNVLKTVNNN